MSLTPDDIQMLKKELKTETPSAEMKKAVLSANWDDVKSLIALGHNPWLVSRQDSDSAEEDENSFDFIVRSMNTPQMAHWLTTQEPHVLLGWLKTMQECFPKEELSRHLNNLSNPEPLSFGHYSVLHLTLTHGAKNQTKEVWLTLIEQLLEAGADPNVGDGKERSCLCALPDDLDRAKPAGELLIKFGVNPTIGLLRGNSFVEEACATRASSLVLLAIEWEFSMDLGMYEGHPRYSPLHVACASLGSSCHVLTQEAFMALLEVNHDRINDVDASGRTPLHHLAIHEAVSHDDERLIQWQMQQLLKAGADQTMKDNTGLTPAALALSKNKSPRMNILLAQEEKEMLNEALPSALKIVKGPKML